MKKILLLLLLFTAFTSCSKDDCIQEALSERVTKNSSSKDSSTSVQVCHNGNTLTINENALQTHLDHGDTEGSCETLSDGGLNFSDGEVVEIACNYELPFIHTADDGSQWYFSSPN